MLSNRILIQFILFGLFLSLPVVNSEEPAGRDKEGHKRMVATLRHIADTTPDSNPYLGTVRARQWRERLRALSVSASPGQRLNVLVNLAHEEAREGLEESVIQRLSEAMDIIKKLGSQVPPRVINDVRYRLGLAYLRRGETQNCCAQNNRDSCIMPIRGQGIHTQTENSRKAIEAFKAILTSGQATSEQTLKASWLINLAYMTLGQYPHGVPEALRMAPDLFGAHHKFPRFPNLAPLLGLDTFQLSGGVIADDFDGDNQLDIVTSTFDPTGQMHYLKNDGQGGFVDKTAEAGLTGILGGINLEQADYDNDGDTDILVLRGAWLMAQGKHPNSLLRNDGDGNFTDVTFNAGLAIVNYPTQTAAWADYDLDGDVDLYIGNEHVGTSHAPSQLFRNNGDGSFTDVAAPAGVENWQFSKGVSWGDYNGDRYPDLYVSNMMGPNRFYRNNGDGTFTDVAGVLNMTKPDAAFPCWFWDVNNDGLLDLYVAANKGTGNSIANVVASTLGIPFKEELACLYIGNPDHTFSNQAQTYGLTKLTLPMGSNYGDLDNDGYLDFYLGTGYPEYDALMPNVMYHNSGGREFRDVSWNGGFGHLQKGHGIAFADFDNDGDQDIYAQMGGALQGDRFQDALFANPGFKNHWISIQLEGTKTNRSAIGARIKVILDQANGTSRQIYRHVNSGGSFGANPLRQSIGLGPSTLIQKLEIYWPTSDTTQVFENIPSDQAILIREGSTQFKPLPLSPIELGSKTL